MILPGAPIPSVWLSDLGLPEGYAVRQGKNYVYLVYGSEDVVTKWNYRRTTRDALIHEIRTSACSHDIVRRRWKSDIIEILEGEER